MWQQLLARLRARRARVAWFLEREDERLLSSAAPDAIAARVLARGMNALAADACDRAIAILRRARVADDFVDMLVQSIDVLGEHFSRRPPWARRGADWVVEQLRDELTTATRRCRSPQHKERYR